MLSASSRVVTKGEVGIRGEDVRGRSRWIEAEHWERRMNFLDVVPIGGTRIREWLLHSETDRAALDGQSAVIGLPLLCQASIGTMDATIMAEVHDILADMVKPNLLLAEAMHEDVMLGSCWTLEDPQLIDSSTGALEGCDEVRVSKKRFAMYFVDGRMVLVVSHHANNAERSTSENVVLRFLKFSEMNGSDSKFEFGFMGRDSGKVLQWSEELPRKHCMYCRAKDIACLCPSSMTSRLFQGELQQRQRAMLTSTHSDVRAKYLAYMSGSLCGTWGHYVDDTPTVSLEMECELVGERMQRAHQIIVEHELALMNQQHHRVGSHAVENRASHQSRSSSSSKEPSEGSKAAGKEKSGRFSCKICGAKFRRQYDIQRHITCVHEKSRNFICTFCGQSFLQKGHLNEHVRAAHDHANAHVCEFCGKRFGIRSKLERHRTGVHMSSKKVSCKLCEETFAHGNELEKHMESRHGAPSSSGADPAAGQSSTEK